jgi:hypothetical protein
MRNFRFQARCLLQFTNLIHLMPIDVLFKCLCLLGVLSQLTTSIKFDFFSSSSNLKVRRRSHQNCFCSLEKEIHISLILSGNIIVNSRQSYVPV